MPLEYKQTGGGCCLLNKQHGKMLTCTSVVVDVFCSRAALVGWSRALVCVCLCLWCVKIIHKNWEKIHEERARVCTNEKCINTECYAANASQQQQILRCVVSV